MKENPHGTVTATVYLVPLTTDRHRQAFSTVCVEKLVKTGNIVVSVRPDQGGINIAEQELIWRLQSVCCSTRVRYIVRVVHSLKSQFGMPPFPAGRIFKSIP